MNKRPFFLLEVVIAITLVSGFSVYFLRSSITHLYQEKNRLLDLEFGWQADVQKMKLLEQGWPDAACFGRKKKMEVQLEVTIDKKRYTRPYSYIVYLAGQNGHYYRITVRENKKNYHFFTKHTSLDPPIIKML